MLHSMLMYNHVYTQIQQAFTVVDPLYKHVT